MQTVCSWTRQTLIGGNCHVPPFIFNDVRVITREPSKPVVLGCICVSSCSDECDQGQWHLLNKISSTYGYTDMCLHTVIHTHKSNVAYASFGCRSLPKFINHICNRPLISVPWCSFKHTGTCPHDRQTHTHTRMHTHTNEQKHFDTC